MAEDPDEALIPRRFGGGGYNMAEDPDDGDDHEDYDEAIVMDMGSHTIKAGFITDSRPRISVPSLVRNGGELACGKLYPKIYVGNDVLPTPENENGKHFQGPYCGIAFDREGPRRPIDRGIFTCSSDMEAIWHHIYYSKLRACPEEHPLFLTEPLLNTKANRERMATVLFDTFQVPALQISPSASLVLHLEGKPTGVALELGFTTSHAVPIFEGYILPHAIVRLDVGGRDVTGYLATLLDERGLWGQFSNGSEWGVGWETARDVKERFAYVALDFDADMNAAAETPALNKTHRVPRSPYWRQDNIVVGNERFRCAEVLFQPSLAHNRVMTAPVFQDGRAFRAAVGLGLSNEGVRARAERLGATGREGLLQLDEACLHAVAAFLSGHNASQISPSVTTWTKCPTQVSTCKGLQQVCGIHGCVFRAIMSCEIRVRPVLFANVVLSGGTTALPGIAERMAKELENRVPSTVNVGVIVSGGEIESVERKYSTWVGAKHKAELNGWISKLEYDKVGPAIVHRASY
jgi:actin-related protein